MTAQLAGKIESHVPYFDASVSKGNVLEIGSGGDIRLTVDTGFSGGIALPADLISRMTLEVAAYDTFRLATGEIVELPVFVGWVAVGPLNVETWFIPGDYLLGMEFLSSVGSSLHFDFNRGLVALTE